MRAVIFDLDDTLYRERDFLMGGFKKVACYVARHYQKPVASVYRCLLKIYSVYGRDNTFGRLLECFQLGGLCEVASLVDMYRAHAPKICLFEDAKYILDRLGKMKSSLGMITDGLDVVQKSKVTALGIEPYFSKIIYTHELGVACYKPNPVSYRLMAADLKCDYKDMVYVGDNPHKDFVSAKKLGMRTVRIRRGPFAQVVANDAYDADMCVESFFGFEQWLEKV